MPSNEKNYKNLTLRLPDQYHRQLLGQTERSGLTLNAQLINIVQRHLMDSGYFPDVIKSRSGRLFEIEVTEIPRNSHEGSYFCSRFDVIEQHPLYSKRRAHYIFGVSGPIAFGSDPYGVVREVGMALLNFYNRQGLEIDQLAWQQISSQPDSPSPTMKDNWRFLDTDVTKNVDQFLITLARDHWKDELLVATGQSQDIRCGLRSEEDLYASPGRSYVIHAASEFERYATETAEKWFQVNKGKKVTEKFSEEAYEVLPRYIQKQIDYDEYFAIVTRCLAKLEKKAK